MRRKGGRGGKEGRFKGRNSIVYEVPFFVLFFSVFYFHFWGSDAVCILG